MKYVSFFFVHKLFLKIIRIIIETVQKLLTSFKFSCNGVKYSNFSTKGIPFVNISYDSGGEIHIGHRFRMVNKLFGNQIGYNTPCILQAIGGTIYIGENVGISQTTLIAMYADIYIGSNSMLGAGVKVYTSDFHSLSHVERRGLDRTPQSASVYIGEDCFVGAGTTLLKGVKIGDRTIIGACSVVTKDIPSDCIAAGNPCKIIKVRENAS